MKKYDVEGVKAMLFLIAKDMREKNIKKQLMTIGKQLIAGDLKTDFDFDEAVRVSQDTSSEYKELVDTMQEEYDKQHKGSVHCNNIATPDPDDDQVNNPSHYQSMVPDLSIDAISCMRAAFGNEEVASFCICNALKYIFRHQSKNGKQDIEKAIWYLNKYLELDK